MKREWDGTKTAIVTGSSRRFGKTVAKRLCDDGWKVIVHGRDEKTTINTMREIGAVAAVVGDLCEQETYTELINAANLRFKGKLGLLVNSASTFVKDGKTFDDRWYNFSDSLWQAHWMYCLTYEARNMLNRCGGMSMSLTDFSAEDSWNGFAAHGMAKHGIEQLTRHLNAPSSSWWNDIGLVSVRLPTVLLPDNMEESTAEYLREKFGDEAPHDRVLWHLMNIVTSDDYSDVYEIDDRGRGKWV